MTHFVSFLMIAAIVYCAVAAALIRTEGRRNRASLWFALALAALGAFLFEIAIYRYMVSLSPLLGPEDRDAILVFSKIWALAGSTLLCVAMPRLACQMTGLRDRPAWRIAEYALPAVCFLAGVAFVCDFGGNVVVALLQTLTFGTSIAALTLIVFVHRGERNPAERKMLLQLAIWSLLLMPLVILDAVGDILPRALNDLPMTLFVPGICVIARVQASRLFSAPAYTERGTPSEHFIAHFEISPRETEVTALLVEGASNADIAARLFVSEKTVENHVSSIFRKTKVKNRIQLYRLIHSLGD